MKTISVLSLTLSREVKKYLKNGISPMPGVPLMLSSSLLVLMPARMLGSPSWRVNDLLGGTLTDDGLLTRR